MEPKLPTPNHGPERLATGYSQNVEHAPLPPTPENKIERGVEKFEQRSEASSAATTTAPTLPMPVIVSEPAITPLDNTTTGTNDDITPLVANDDDLIEKEWVDKAKKIIIDTKDDPYQREYQVGKLQADYLRKRYGRELGAS